ncbi:hypothetical protein OROHE_008700 [Orobanche hederae]
MKKRPRDTPSESSENESMSMIWLILCTLKMKGL